MSGRWRRRLHYWLRSGQRARLLREEMESHLEFMAQEFMEEGMNEADARAAARRRFGNLTRHQEDARVTWIARWLGDLAQDAVFAVRTLRRRPGFTTVAVLSAALGVGACSTIFAVANYALFRPLAVEDPAGLLSISASNLRRGKAGQNFSYPEFEDLAQAPSFQHVAGFAPYIPAAIADGGEARRYWGTLATPSYFEAVRPQFAAGRGFDNSVGADPVVVLSYRLWQARFRADREIVGRTLLLNSRKVTVLGVTGPGFQGTESMFPSDFWLPSSNPDNLADAGVARASLSNRNSQWLTAVGRLRPGGRAKTAAGEISAIGQRLRASFPESNRDRGFDVEPAGRLNPGVRRIVSLFFVLLLGAAILVLITACANVANLLLARAAARRKEIATRIAIGAGRGRLVRQLLTESMTLALAGGAAGLLLARYGASAIASMRLPITMPLDLGVALDYRVALFSLALSLLTGLIFGLAPALRVTAPNLAGQLKEAPARHSLLGRFGGRNLLVIAQVAICMVLLICSGLFLRSLDSARAIDTGMGHRNLLLAAFDPGLNHYPPQKTQQILNEILRLARTTPGVESAALTSSVPLSLEGTRNRVKPAERSAEKNASMLADIYAVTPGFFDTFGIPLLRGEDFRPGMPAEDIAIANQALATKAFPGRDPIGQRILYLDRTVRITGLVATAKSRTIGEEPRPCLYFPLAREGRGNDSLTGITLAVRTRGNPSAYAAQMRDVIRRTDPALAVFDLRTMESHLSRALFLPRTASVLFGITGGMALLIAIVGVYGVISFAVARRTREIGVRMAMGASRGRILAEVLRQGMGLTLAGSVIGFPLALALARLAGSLLYGIGPADPLTLLGVPAVLLLVSLVACLVPAGRAAALDPTEALRLE
jgi:predicted permease